MKSLEHIFKFAMDLEIQGANFYKESAQKITNPVTRAIFEKLYNTELEHYDFLKRELEKFKATSTVMPMDDDMKQHMESEIDIFHNRGRSEHLEAVVSESDVPDMAILRMAYLIERDAAEFYRDAASSTEDAEAVEVFNSLAKWEDAHEEMFRKEYKRRMEEYMNAPWGG